MNWSLSHRFDPEARQIADRHYNRRKPGSPQFVPPGRCLVLKNPTAVWVTSWPFAEYVRHAWPGLMVCSAFRNEGNVRSSDLIREALAATRWKWPEAPTVGMVTFVDPTRVRRKRHPGYCYLMAGFDYVGETKGKLRALGIVADRAYAWPKPEAPHGAQGTLL